MPWSCTLKLMLLISGSKPQLIGAAIIFAEKKDPALPAKLTGLFCQSTVPKWEFFGRPSAHQDGTDVLLVLESEEGDAFGPFRTRFGDTKGSWAEQTQVRPCLKTPTKTPRLHRTCCRHSQLDWPWLRPGWVDMMLTAPRTTLPFSGSFGFSSTPPWLIKYQYIQLESLKYRRCWRSDYKCVPSWSTVIK